MIGTFRSVCSECTTAEGLAALYAYESQIPAVSESKIKGLVEERLPEQDLVFKHEGSKDYAENNIANSYIKWVDYFQYDLAKNPEAEAEVDFMLNTYC